MAEDKVIIESAMPLEFIRPAETVIREDVAGEKRKVMKLTGRLQYANKPNQNGRIYEKAVLEQAIKSIEESIKSRRVLGEFDHPSDAKIHLANVSHLITKLWMEGEEVLGEMEILEDTTSGHQLKALVKAGVQLGISSRGAGEMEQVVIEGEEYHRVLPGYSLITFDIVAEPSVPGAYLSVLESRERRIKNFRKEHEQAIIEELKKHLS